MDNLELNYLKSLAKQFPNVASASTEIINLQAIMSLPKGTEHFLTDIHGEWEQFNHVMRNGSGSVRRKIDEKFGHTLTEKDKRALATLIYYPKDKLALIEEEEEFLEDWYKITLHRLVSMLAHVSSKYTRSKVRKALPKDFSYVIEELITEKEELEDKEAYYNEIINTIIKIGSAQDFIVELCNLIQEMVVDHLHIVGDIFDRGKRPQLIMDTLMGYHSLDIQWGNHDVVWMGAAAGELACVASVIRNSARYGNLDTIEEGYGINLVPLATFALTTYKNTDCSRFAIKYDDDYNTRDLDLDMKVHKAISIIQFKLEGQLIKRHPEWHMEDRLLLDKIDFNNKTIVCYGKTYDMLDVDFPTVNPADPYALTEEETEVMNRLKLAFKHSEKLKKHVKFLYSKGAMYRIHNSNLLYHGCVPMDSDGNFMSLNLRGQEYSGKALYDALESLARKGFYSEDHEERMYGRDVLYYIWAGPVSPVYGKDKMTTFERYFIEDSETHKEKKNPYYDLYDNEDIVNSIFAEFSLNPQKSHIINGHVPVIAKKGETPVKCNGKLLVIDGGFAKAYQDKTGIAGYTLVGNSHGLFLVSHQPFVSKDVAVVSEADIVCDRIPVELETTRIRVADTDIGTELKERIAQLERLLKAYKEGLIREK